MGREVSVGGPASRDDVTCSIQFSDVVATWHAVLENRVGVGRVKVAYTFLGPDRLPYSTTHTVVGTLKSVTLPDFSADSSDVGMYEIVVSADEQAA